MERVYYLETQWKREGEDEILSCKVSLLSVFFNRLIYRTRITLVLKPSVYSLLMNFMLKEGECIAIVSK